MYCFLCFPIAFCLLIHSTAGQDLEITCPPKGFTVGVNDSITCKVKKTAFASACLSTPTLVKFHFTPLNGVQNQWCTSSYSTCPDIGTPDPLCGNCSCGCTNDDGTFLTQRLDFIPTSAHRGGNFTCEVVCLNSGNLPALTNQDCSGVLVVAPTTPPPNTTSDSPGTTTESSESPISPTATGSPTATSTGNSSTSGPASPPTGNSSTSSSTDSTSIATSPGTASDPALYIGLGFVGLVCLVGIVVVCVLIVRQRKSKKKLATTSANDGNPDQEGENNHAYINTTL